MKKIFSILAIATLLSCSNDDEDSTPNPACACGTVIEVKILAPQRYQTKIKNNCTGVIEDILLVDKYEIGWIRCD